VAFLVARALFSRAWLRVRKHACRLIQDRLAVSELALVVAHGLDRFCVSAGELLGDLLVIEPGMAGQLVLVWGAG
jgi:hypothetical protein